MFLKIVLIMDADFVHHDYEELAEGMVNLFQDVEEILKVKDLDLDDYQVELIMEMVMLLIYTDYTIFYTPYDENEDSQ